MKCNKCAKSAVIHLTEIVADSSGSKRAVELHLCLGHAEEAGLIAPGSELLPQVISANLKPAKPAMALPESEESGTAIVPKEPASGGGLVVTREKGEAAACPICGLTWSAFKQSGLMGCAHDYELYDSKLLPLLKRAQEGATEHVGKIPQRKKTEESERQVSSLRIRRDLRKAIDAENYEQAARLRDELRQLERN
jgi:protein arginine kinase activator